MHRREVLELAGATGLLGTSLLSGCLGAPTEGDVDAEGDENGSDRDGSGGEDGSDGTADETGSEGDDEAGSTGDDEVVWVHDVSGRVDAVAHGAVFGREDFMADGADGGVFALDRETGDHRWTYGRTGGYSRYSKPTITDAVFFGLGDDAIGSGSGELYALELDGTERWKQDTGSIYSRPRVVDGVVYVAGDDGVVRAFASADGAPLWRTGDLRSESPEIAIADVADAVYVATAGLVALDRDDGSERWRYGVGDERIRDATVVDGVAYVADGEGVAAVAGGEERWHVAFESNAFVQTVTNDRVLVRHGWDLFALDTANGDERWVLEGVERMRVAVHGDVVYVGGERVRALDVGDGDERWSVAIGDGESVRSVTVEEDSADGARAVYVHTDDDRLVRLDSGGENTWSVVVDGSIRDVLVDEFVFVGTDGGISALDPR